MCSVFALCLHIHEIQNLVIFLFPQVTLVDMKAFFYCTHSPLSTATSSMSCSSWGQVRCLQVPQEFSMFVSVAAFYRKPFGAHLSSLMWPLVPQHIKNFMAPAEFCCGTSASVSKNKIYSKCPQKIRNYPFVVYFCSVWIFELFVLWTRKKNKT